LRAAGAAPAFDADAPVQTLARGRAHGCWLTPG
jgi:hypothetical protein